MSTLEGIIEAELDRLARDRLSPEAFEALLRALWLSGRPGSR
jgi:hypothetical protein